MNKRIILFALLLISIHSKSQTRTIETRMSFLWPKLNTMFTMPTNLKIKFSAYNIGPDSIFKGDTFVYKVNYNGKLSEKHYIRLDSNIYPGDSLFFEDSMDLDINNPKSGTLFVTLIYAYFFNGSKNPHGSYYSDLNFYDNNITTFYKYQNLNNNITIKNGEMSPMKLYPNPFEKSFIIENKTNFNAIYSIFSLDGKFLIEGIIPNFNSDSISLINYPSGIYFIKINANNQIYNYKIMKT